MKANQKFLKAEEDEAVSPVIAVILMVAITVVLAATVYVWVSGFGSSSSTPAKSLSLTSSAAINQANTIKSYTVSSATSGMKWSDVTITLNGATLGYDGTTAGAPGAGKFQIAQAGTTVAGTSTPANVVGAGDTLVIQAASGLSGQTLRVLDSQANSVMLTLTVG